MKTSCFIDMLVKHCFLHIVGHSVAKVKLSPPIPHDTTSHASIQWKVPNIKITIVLKSDVIINLFSMQFFSLVMKGVTEDEQRRLFEKFSRTMRSM